MAIDDFHGKIMESMGNTIHLGDFVRANVGKNSIVTWSIWVICS